MGNYGAPHGGRVSTPPLTFAANKLHGLYGRFGHVFTLARERKWRHVGRIEPEGFDWFERKPRAPVSHELHIDDAGQCWAEHGDGWRVLADREVAAIVFAAI